MTDPCVFFGVPPALIFDADFFEHGIKVIDMNKLERLVCPEKGESIADATLRKFGRAGVTVVLFNLGF